MVACGITALALVFVCFKPFYNVMRRLKYGESIREGEGFEKLSKLHASKKDTVTMGGVLFLLSVIPATLIWADLNIYVLTTLGVFLSFGLIGFADDLLKVLKKNKAGVDGKMKLLLQLLVTIVTLTALLWHPSTSTQIRELWLPLVDNPFMQQMPLYMTFGLLFFVLVGTSNTVNLTDGADGLATGCSITALLAFAAIAYFAGTPLIAQDLDINLIPGAKELCILVASLVGACLAFLWFNGHPAKVFMGDTGSLSLGGSIGIVAFLLNQPFILIVIGGIFVIEGFSVILQVASFQLTGKKIFHISPLHHHFEVAGWPESQVVLRFWIMSVVFGLLGLWSFTL